MSLGIRCFAAAVLPLAVHCSAVPGARHESENVRDASAGDETVGDGADKIGDAGDGPSCIGSADCPGCSCDKGDCTFHDGAESTTCTPVDQQRFIHDSCGCDGKTCTGGATCLRVTSPAPHGAGGPPELFNACFGVCRDDSDCNGNVCRRNEYGVSVCAGPACRSDADCKADSCGRCAAAAMVFHGGQIRYDFTRSSCLYLGECGPGVCSACAPPPPPFTTSIKFHVCR